MEYWGNLQCRVSEVSCHLDRRERSFKSWKSKISPPAFAGVEMTFLIRLFVRRHTRWGETSGENEWDTGNFAFFMAHHSLFHYS